MTALITGASAGIGREFCDVLAQHGHDLVLVARNSEKLHEVKLEVENRYPNIKCEVLVADLSVSADVARVADRLSQAQKPVDVLVNNAGLGLNQRFVTGDVEQESYLLDVLVSAVMRLTYAAASAMKQRGKGDIVVVSSVASFIAGGTYSAAKSWNTVFVESLAQELRNSGVKVSALCPGFTHTEFHQRAGMNKGEIPSWMWMSVHDVVRIGWRDHKRGKVISVPGIRYKFLVALIRIMPRPVVRRVGFVSRNRSRH